MNHERPSDTQAAAYVRRSTRSQEQSLERQRHEIERFAAAAGITIVRWYVDDGISGAEDLERPGFQKLISDAEALGDFRRVLVHELSRFGRFDSFQLGSWLHRFRNARVRIQAIAGPVKDPYSREGKLLLGLEQDREESVKLSLRTLSGQRETAEKGRRAGGKVPYGFARRVRRADGTIEILGRAGRAKRDKSEVVELVLGDDLEVAVVRDIFRWSAAGDGFRTIVQRLNDRGAPSPDAHRVSTSRANRRGRWTTSTVRSMLLNPAYVGDAIWNVRSMPRFHRLEAGELREIDPFEEGRFRINARADWVTVPNAHPALVDRALFDAVQSRLASNSRRASPRAHEYLLSGLVSCGNCGSPMTGSTRVRRKTTGGETKTYLYPGYSCAGAKAAGDCRQVAVPRDNLERAIFRILDDEVFAPEAIEQLEAALARAIARRRTGGDASSTRRHLERRVAELERQVADGARRLLDIPDELVADVREALAAKKAELEGARAAFEEERSRNRTASVDDDRVRDTLDEIRSLEPVLKNKSVSLERRREVLRRLLPAPKGKSPIVIHFDFAAGRGWKQTLKRATVAHLSLRQATVAPKMVAGAGFEPATSGL